ncbi:MAG: hypothetical protein LBO66_12415 [Deltaproteobacteria bacterium]|nr:hypothetical protein [Deltaproteobacteria bacterium]
MTKEDSSKLFALTKQKLVFPLDETFGLDKLPFKMSVSAMLEVAYLVQKIPSFKGAEEEIKRTTQIITSSETIRNIANNIGKLIFEKDQQDANEAWDLLESGKLMFPEKKKPHILYIETDGAMLHVRKPVDKEKSDDDSIIKSPWMENKLGMVFSTDNFKKINNEKGEEEARLGKREYIAYLGSAEEFKKHLWALALRNGYGTYGKTILLSDGASWIKYMKEELFPDSQHILDYCHLSENISTFAKDIFDNIDIKYKPWAKAMKSLIIEGRYQEVLTELKGISSRQLSKSSINLTNYITNNKYNIDYTTYRKNGWIIGSGGIESANRTVLQQRLKQTGMRWNVENGQYILSLMAKSKSNLWNVVNEIVKNKYEIESALEALGARNYTPSYVRDSHQNLWDSHQY